MKILRTIQIPLTPNKEQRNILMIMLRTSQHLYNYVAKYGFNYECVNKFKLQLILRPMYRELFSFFPSASYEKVVENVSESLKSMKSNKKWITCPQKKGPIKEFQGLPTFSLRKVISDCIVQEDKNYMQLAYRIHALMKLHLRSYKVFGKVDKEFSDEIQKKVIEMEQIIEKKKAKIMRLKCPKCDEEMNCPGCPFSPIKVNYEEEPACPWCIDDDGPVMREMESRMKMKPFEMNSRRKFFKEQLPFYCARCYKEKFENNEV